MSDHGPAPAGRTARLARLLDLLRQLTPRRPPGQDPRPRDGGAAAIEAGLVLTLLLIVSGVLAPLPFAMLQKTRLETAAARTARWATSAPGGVRPLPLTAPPRTSPVPCPSLPSPPPNGPATTPDSSPPCLLLAEAQQAFSESGGSDVLDRGQVTYFDVVDAAQCPMHRARVITLGVHVTLGSFAALMSAAGITSKTLALTASATACEE